MARRKRRRPHGLGCVYQRGPGNFWIKWREGGRVRYAHGFPTRELAEQVRAKIAADIATGRAGLPPDLNTLPTLAEAAKDWIERREHTHRSWKDDRGRWQKHLKPFFGTCRPPEVSAAAIRSFVETKLAEGLAGNSVGNCVRLLSTFYADLVERGLASANPVRALPRSTRRLYRPSNDPRTTPFIERMEDVARIFRVFPEPINIAFAVGALAGLRTGEILGLDWSHVDLTARRIHVQRQVRAGKLAPVKDDDSRVIPIEDALAPTLRAWRMRSGGRGLVFPPSVAERGGRPGHPPRFMRPATLHRHLARALDECGMARLTWYRATRHTFASQWVLANGSIEKLSKMLGHASVVTTERYAHLRPGLFREADHAVLQVALAAGAAEPRPLLPNAAAAVVGG